MGEYLLKLGIELRDVAKQIEDAEREQINERFNLAQESSLNIVKAFLAVQKKQDKYK